MSELQDLWHQALANQVNRVQMSSPDTKTDHWRRAGRPTKAKPEGENLAWWKEEGVRQLEVYSEWLRNTDMRFVEFNGDPLIEFNVSGMLGERYVKGYIDSVMWDGEKNILIDYKSGSRTPFGLMQLGVYRILLKNLTGIDATHGMFWMTRKGEPTEPAELSRYTNEYVSKIFSQFHCAVENEVFIPNEGNHCFSCDVRSACYVQGGVHAYQWDPDHPSYKVTS